MGELSPGCEIEKTYKRLNNNSTCETDVFKEKTTVKSRSINKFPSNDRLVSN